MYSFVELRDGQILKRFKVPFGLQEKLRELGASGERIDFHVLRNPDGAPELLALRAGDGTTFATEMRGVDRSTPILLLIAFLFLGVVTLPLLGLGLYFWWLGWKVWKAGSQRLQARRYVTSLPNAILI